MSLRPGNRLGAPGIAALSIAIFAINAFLCRELFTVEYLSTLGSIDPAFIALARYIREHPADRNWFPLWYGGIPFQNTYPPILPILTAVTSALWNVSPGLAYHAVTATMYCLGPVTLFWLLVRLSGRVAWSFYAAALYSIFSPSAFLVDLIARDTASPWTARRLQNLVIYGEGPHVSALALLPAALLALDSAMRKTTAARALVAALALAAVALTNWIGAYALALSILALFLAHAEPGLTGAWLKKALGIGLLAYSLAAPLVPPSTVAVVRRNSPHMEGYYPLGPKQALYAGLICLAAWLLHRRLSKRRLSPATRFSWFLLLITGTIVVLWDRFGMYVVPQPVRYHLELDMAICLVAAMAAGWLFARLPQRGRAWVAAALCLPMAAQWRAHRDSARLLIRPAEMQDSVEYQAARWLEENRPGARLFAIGSVEYWLNVFARNPQLGGGFGPGVTNPQILNLRRGLWTTQGNGPESVLWLRAFGADAIFVGGPGGREYFKAFRDPAKFRGLLPELWRNGDDVIYGVPGTGRPAHIVGPQDVVAQAPEGFQDLAGLRQYVAAIENPGMPLAALQWHGPDRVSILAAALEPHQLVALQLSYHHGWRASANGSPRPIRKDGLGLMVVEPRCSGDCQIELTYDGGLEMKLARLAPAGALLFLAGWFWIERREVPSSLA